MTQKLVISAGPRSLASAVMGSGKEEKVRSANSQNIQHHARTARVFPIRSGFPKAPFDFPPVVHGA